MDPVEIIDEVIGYLRNSMYTTSDDDGAIEFEPFTFTREDAEDIAYLADKLEDAVKLIETP